jgi:hypothetical protein
MGKKSGSGSGINNPDNISESLETFFGYKYSIDTDPGSGMKTNRIRNPRWKNSDSASGINIPDPQHWWQVSHNPGTLLKVLANVMDLAESGII